MDDYYTASLSAQRLKRCYEIAAPRVEQYLQAEIDFVAQHTHNTSHVLELGCGYGRAMAPLAHNVDTLIGIDTSAESLSLAAEVLASHGNCYLARMDAITTAFHDRTFDVVFCIQNGISAFHVDQALLVREAMRVARPGSAVLFSSYAESFWDDRLAWFRAQADEGLLGEIDDDATGNGTIVCRDGFRTTTATPDCFRALARQVGIDIVIVEVDQSAVFGIIHP